MHREVQNAGAAIHKLVDACESGQADEHVWNETQDQLRKVRNSGDTAELTRQLESTGLLPRLICDTAAAMAPDQDGNLTRDGLDKTIKDRSGNVKEETRFAAKYVREHFDRMDENDDDRIDTDELNDWKENHQATEDPDDKFSYKTGNDSGDTDSSSSSEKSDDCYRECTATLEDKNATAEQKLQAIEKLHDNGNEYIYLKDDDGNTQKYRIAVEDIDGHSKYVHLFDEHNHPVIRAINRRGNYEEEVKGDGFVGSRWKKHPGNSNITDFNRDDED